MSTSIEYTSKQGPVLEKTFEDANDQHVTRVVGYANTEDYAGIFADSEFSEIIDAKELYRLCCLGVLAIDLGDDSFRIPVAYDEESCSVIDTETAESATTVVLRTITFEAD